ncbi:hypothetical protein [Atopobium fossor]|uniref:hypothetical protein n=1 Tax=Atopobium fossor TaxID=39487 RepID=UPI000485C945|nr:hypothetical protein [Atopobium fossor]
MRQNMWCSAKVWVHQVDAQMSIELAVLMPVVLVMSLLVFNLARYLGLGMKFSAECSHAIVNLGTTQTSTIQQLGNPTAVKQAIEKNMQLNDLGEIEVQVHERNHFIAETTTFSFLPKVHEYICTLRIKPWPSHFVIAGVSFSPPPFMVYEYRLFVDPYRSGVVV